MKLKIIILLIAAVITAAGAYEENYWPRSYFVRAGMGITATTGDLNERPVSVKDTSGNKFKTYPPDISLMGDPEFGWGWCADRFDIIQTDWIGSLSRYLEKTGRRYRK